MKVYFPDVQFNIDEKGEEEKIECTISESGAEEWAIAGIMFSTALALNSLTAKHIEDEKYVSCIRIKDNDNMEIIPAWPMKNDGKIIKGKAEHLSLEGDRYKKLPGWLWVKVFKAIIESYAPQLLEAYNAAIKNAGGETDSNGEGEEISPDDPDFC